MFQHLQLSCPDKRDPIRGQILHRQRFQILPSSWMRLTRHTMHSPRQLSRRQASAMPFLRLQRRLAPLYSQKRNLCKCQIVCYISAVPRWSEAMPRRPAVRSRRRSESFFFSGACVSTQLFLYNPLDLCLPALVLILHELFALNACRRVCSAPTSPQLGTDAPAVRSFYSIDL